EQSPAVGLGQSRLGGHRAADRGGRLVVQFNTCADRGGARWHAGGGGAPGGRLGQGEQAGGGGGGHGAGAEGLGRVGGGGGELDPGDRSHPRGGVERGLHAPSLVAPNGLNLAQESAPVEEFAQMNPVLVTGQPDLAPLGRVQLWIVPAQLTDRSRAAAFGG